MKHLAERVYRSFIKALYDTIDHDGIEHAGYLAFLSLLSLFPFLVFFVATVGFFGQSELGVKLVGILLNTNVIPEHVRLALEPRIEEIVSGPPQGLLTIAILGSIWTASSAVEGMRTTLNRAYRVSTPPAYIWRRLMSILQFFILTVALILSMILLIILPVIWQWIQDTLFLHDLAITPMFHYLRYGISALIAFIVVASFFYILPNIQQRWHSVAPGALAVVALWFVAGSLFSAYLSNFEQVHLIYGSLGGIIAALLFFYITALIFIFGAEFNYQLEKSAGHKIRQKQKSYRRQH